MKTQIANLKLPTSVWQALHRIDNLLGQALSWPKRLEEINSILLHELEVDAIWLLTVKPLPPTACGSMRTPLAIAPHAQVHLVDNQPPIDDNWPTPDSLLGQVMVSRQPRFIEPNSVNGRTDSDLGDVLFGTFEAIPSAVVPLVADGHSIGALIVGSYDLEKVPPPKEAQNLLTYLGEHVGSNLHNAYWVERSQKHANALKMLNLIAHTITSSLELDEVIQRTMAGINEILEVEAGSLLLVDEETQELYFKITLRGENKQITSYRLRIDEGIAGWVITHNQPTVCNNARADKRFSPKIDEAINFRTRNVLCAPLVVHGRPIGALEVLNKHTGFFTQEDQELLISMTASLGVAVENAQLYEEAQERARRNEIINQITTAINTGHSLVEMGKFIFEQLRRLIAFDHISISLLDDSRQNIQQWLLTEHGSFEHSRSLIPLAGSALAEVITLNQARIYNDLTRPACTASRLDHQILRDDNVVSAIMMPLITKKSPYGSLTLGRQHPHAYGAKELKLLEQITPQLSIAIEKSRLLDVMEQHNAQLKQLNHLSEMLVSTIDLSLIIDTTLSKIPRLLPGDVQGVVLGGEEGVYLGVALPFDFAYTDQILADIHNTFVEVSEGRTPTQLVYSKQIAGNMPVPANWQPVTVRHLPIITRLGTLGLIYFASGQNENISDELLRTFSLIASQIAASVENARLFQQIEQERARLAAILASSTDAILVVNRDGRIVLDNPAAWQVMGVETSQRDQLLAESTRNRALIQLFKRAMQEGQLTGEITLADGRTFFANFSPVEVGNTEVIGSVATMQDVSHFKELNQLKTDFVNSVSHDLRSPLSGILIATHLLPQMGVLAASQQELIETIENRVAGMSRLIDDLLDVGKIEAGIDMEMEPCDLAPLVESVAQSLLPQAHNKLIQLTWDLAFPSPIVLANPTRLQQVIHNLVSNAIKYTPDAGRVMVKVSRQGNESRIQVSDTGIGIPTTDQPHIFEKFYRVRGDHVANIKGTGLGLAITKSIVEKHNGRIWLESVLGEGSTFTVALACADPVQN